MLPNDGLSLRTGQDDDYRRDTIERDEKRLAELGRRTVEMFVISQVFTERLEVRACVEGWGVGGGWGMAEELASPGALAPHRSHTRAYPLRPQVACREAEALKWQDQLIAEELASPGTLAPHRSHMHACPLRPQVAYREAEALKRQDQLIAEEHATQQLEDTRRKEQAEREKEKRSKKKVGGRGRGWGQGESREQGQEGGGGAGGGSTLQKGGGGA